MQPCCLANVQHVYTGLNFSVKPRTFAVQTPDWHIRKQAPSHPATASKAQRDLKLSARRSSRPVPQRQSNRRRTTAGAGRGTQPRHSTSRQFCSYPARESQMLAPPFRPSGGRKGGEGEKGGRRGATPVNNRATQPHTPSRTTATGLHNNSVIQLDTITTTQNAKNETV